MLLRVELDNLLWRESDNISIKTLWEYLCTYCYLPRLANEKVLLECIQAGVNSAEYFAIASGFDGNRYIDLKFNQFVGLIEKSAYLVKIDVAQRQLVEEAAKRQAEAESNSDDQSFLPSGNVYPNHLPTGASEVREGKGERYTPTEVMPKRFFMSANLDTTRINRDVQKYVEEIIQHLTSDDGANVSVSLEVHAESLKGFSQQTVRTVSENCRTLKVRDSGFEEE